MNQLNVLASALVEYSQLSTNRTNNGAWVAAAHPRAVSFLSHRGSFLSYVATLRPLNSPLGRNSPKSHIDAHITSSVAPGARVREV